MEDFRFKQLKEILFADGQQEFKELADKVESIQQDINTKPRLQQKIEPILDEKINYLKEHFPELFGPAVTKSIKVQIKESQGEIIEALYPIMGRLIKKYVIHEVELLSERIDQQLDKLFSWQGWLDRLKFWVANGSFSDKLIAEAMKPQIEEVFVIEQLSSVLVGSYSRKNITDQDMIAGMLGAIKSFVQEAFLQQQETLQTIEYETYRIVVRDFKSYYVAVTISGAVTRSFVNEVDTKITDFMEDALHQTIIQKAKTDEVSVLLQKYFSN